GGAALVIMMSAYGDDDSAVDAVKRGAHDFIQKPFRADQVLLVLAKAIEREGLRAEVRRLSDEVAELRGPGGIVGHSDALCPTIPPGPRSSATSSLSRRTSARRPSRSMALASTSST